MSKFLASNLKTRSRITKGVFTLIHYYCRKASELTYSELDLDDTIIDLIKPIGTRRLVELARTHDTALTNRIQDRLQAKSYNNHYISLRSSKQYRIEAKRITNQIKKSLKKAGYFRDDVSFESLAKLCRILKTVIFNLTIFEYNTKKSPQSYSGSIHYLKNHLDAYTSNLDKLKALEYHIDYELLYRIRNRIYETFDFETANRIIPDIFDPVLSPSQKEFINWYCHNDTVLLSKEEERLLDIICINIVKGIDSIIEPYCTFFQPALPKSRFQ